MTLDLEGEQDRVVSTRHASPMDGPLSSPEKVTAAQVITSEHAAGEGVVT